MSTKKELRKIFRSRRTDIPPGEAEDLSQRLCRRLLASGLWNAAKTVHLFLPITRLREVDTYPLLEAALQQKKTAAISVSDMQEGSMACYAMAEDTPLAESDYGIPEPVEPSLLPPVFPQDIDLVVVPLLAYDRFGGRVGYGRGFYDRFLKQCRPDVLKAGVSFFPPEEERISDLAEDDIPLDCCFTPEGEFFFKER